MALEVIFQPRNTLWKNEGYRRYHVPPFFPGTTISKHNNFSNQHCFVISHVILLALIFTRGHAGKEVKALARCEWFRACLYDWYRSYLPKEQ